MAYVRGRGRLFLFSRGDFKSERFKVSEVSIGCDKCNIVVDAVVPSRLDRVGGCGDIGPQKEQGTP